MYWVMSSGVSAYNSVIKLLDTDTGEIHGGFSWEDILTKYSVENLTKDGYIVNKGGFICKPLDLGMSFTASTVYHEGYCYYLEEYNIGSFLLNDMGVFISYRKGAHYIGSGVLSGGRVNLCTNSSLQYVWSECCTLSEYVRNMSMY